MITVPVTVLDDFLDNPNAIRNFALSLNYTQSPIGNYPGGRTECISQIHSPFYSYVSKKILNLFFPTELKTGTSSMYFHLSKDTEGTGWIHQDNAQITSIIYLSPEDLEINRGTSLYKLKENKFSPFNTPQENSIVNYMPDHYLTGKIDEKTHRVKNNWEEITFDKILDIPDRFNRLICFDPATYHANNNIKSPNSPDRLTLITLFYKISHPSNFPIPRSKQTLSI